MEFKIIAPGADNIEIVHRLPSSFTGLKLPGAESIVAKAHFGKMIFQNYKGNGFDIWYSNYLIRQDTDITGRADIPVLELHIQFLNQFSISWDARDRNVLKPYQYNITYTPFVNSQVKFVKDRNYHTFDIHFSMEYLKRLSNYSPLLEDFLLKVEKKEPANISTIDRFLTPEMIVVVNNILNCNFQNGLHRFYIESKVMELLTMVLDHISGAHPLLPLKLTEYDMERLHQAKNILLSDFDTEISLASLSRKVGLNECKLKKGFKYLFGTTVFGCLQNARMEKAREMLLETKLPIEDIAYMTGYDFVSNFNLAFKKHFTYTAAELRKHKKS